jgi:hypothetical protein
VIQLAPSPVALAWATTHIETDEASLGVTPAGLTAPFAPQQMRTFRLVPLSIADADGDGALRTSDCDDANGAIWSAPGEVRSLVLSKPPGSSLTTLSWTAPLQPGGSAPAYDTLRSAVRSSFTTATVCVESSDATNTLSTDSAQPAPGSAYFYLVRAETACVPGAGSLGAGSNGVPRAGRTCP